MTSPPHLHLQAKNLLCFVIAFGGACALLGCSPNSGVTALNSTPGNSAGAAARTLSAAQIAATQAGVQKMVPNAATAKFSNHAARIIANKPGIHVCGYVNYLDSDNLKTVEQPYYVELREVNGQPSAERGQVGGDPGKLAKVRFLCREHGIR